MLPVIVINSTNVHLERKLVFLIKKTKKKQKDIVKSITEFLCYPIKPYSDVLND